MTLDHQVVIEHEYPTVLSWDLVEQWAAIPDCNKSDPSNPPWRRTPVIEADLTEFGYGVVHIKDESDQRSNLTGVAKDRPTWEIAGEYRDHARNLLRLRREGSINGNIGDLPVPRMSIISSGNAGKSLAFRFGLHGLPPIKILADAQLDETIVEELAALRADVYQVPLDVNIFEPDERGKDRPYTAEEIKLLTGNTDGVDLTSIGILRLEEVSYDFHVREALSEKPDDIYVPYGSGRLWENYLFWQRRHQLEPDFRLPIDFSGLGRVSVMGVRPDSLDSQADKLVARYNPFIKFDENDVRLMRLVGQTGEFTSVYQVPEERILQAHKIMNKFVNAEVSAAAGLALYLQRFDDGQIDPRSKVLVVNTGRGS